MNKMEIGDKFDEILVIPRGKYGRLLYEGKDYRGMFRITPRGTKLQLINIIHMDDYLKGVVPPEIGFFKDTELEAIKAQAVAARTYAMSHLDQYPEEEYDMKADVSDQVYLGVAVENDNVSRAVDATRGYVIKYRGKFINAYYHSTCGGYTDDIDQVWERAGEPYLRAVDDSGFCDWSKYYEWVESYNPKQMRLMLEQYLSAEKGRHINVKAIRDIFVKSTTAGGRVAEVVVKTADKEYTFGKDKIRWVFKRASNPELILQSARFRIDIDRDSGGKITRIDLRGGGYGHGVGMCQCGAIGMARRGWEYQDILTFYYRNVDLVRLY
jgi:stage II sporulation protein D